MGFPDASEDFDTSAALAVLDRIADRGDAEALQSVAPAWEAAWIACLTNSDDWRSVAQDEFAHVVVELHGILWTVDRRKVRSTPWRLGPRSGRLSNAALVTAEPFVTVPRGSRASLEPGAR